LLQRSSETDQFQKGQARQEINKTRINSVCFGLTALATATVLKTMLISIQLNKWGL
jgi:hypothetical protein